MKIVPKQQTTNTHTKSPPKFHTSEDLQAST